MSLPSDEKAWALESLRAGDSLAEVADACDCDLLSLARELRVFGYVPPSLRWVRSPRSGEERVRPWCGGLLKEVVAARYLAGEQAVDLAAEARVCRKTIYVLVAALGARRRRARRGSQAQRAAA